MTVNPVTPILKRLKQPLDPARVKWRDAPKGEQVPYLEGYDTIATANEIFEFHWSFEIGEPQVRQWQRAQTRWDDRQKTRIPTLGQDGQPITELVGIAWVTGCVTVHMDGQPYAHSDVGRCKFIGDTPEAFATAISGCVTDCLKRCFRQLGRQFGNDLYNKAARAELPRAGYKGAGRQPARKQAAAESPSMTLDQARAIPCPLGSKSHPEYKGLLLEEVAQSPDGTKVLEYLAGDQYRANGDKNGQKAKAAARLLLDAMQPAK